MKKGITEKGKEEGLVVGKNVGGSAWAESLWGTSWTYIYTVVDTAREPFVILDHELRVIAANETFYRVFKVTAKDTEGKLLYELGDGQWNKPALCKLLEDILPKDTFFRGFEVDYDFPMVGRKTMLLNARRIYQNKKDTSPALNPIILLAIEDITELTVIAEKLAWQTRKYEAKMIERADELEDRINELTYLNKTVMGFDKTIVGLASVIESLKGDVVALKNGKN